MPTPPPKNPTPMPVSNESLTQGNLWKFENSLGRIDVNTSQNETFLNFSPPAVFAVPPGIMFTGLDLSGAERFSSKVTGGVGLFGEVWPVDAAELEPQAAHAGVPVPWPGGTAPAVDCTDGREDF